MAYDHPQSPRLGQRTAMENPGVRICNQVELPEVAYRGEIIYLEDLDVFQVYDGNAWQTPDAESETGIQTFVQDTAPTNPGDNLAVGDLWLNPVNREFRVWNGEIWLGTNTNAGFPQHWVNFIYDWISLGLDTTDTLFTISDSDPDGFGWLSNRWWLNVTSYEIFKVSGGVYVSVDFVDSRSPIYQWAMDFLNYTGSDVPYVARIVTQPWGDELPDPTAYAEDTLLWDEERLYLQHNNEWVISLPEDAAEEPGEADQTFTQTFVASSNTWTILHNLNKRFVDVITEDANGDTIYGDIEYTSDDVTTVSFFYPQTGIARVST